MSNTESVESSTHITEKHSTRGNLLRAIHHAVHLLPTQGPITVFVHHNTLHAFEDLPFEKALELGGKRHAHETYLPEHRYRLELSRNRIRASDLDAVLQDELRTSEAEQIAGLVSRHDLYRAMLRFSLQQGPTSGLHWYMAETDALRRYHPDAPREITDGIREQTRHWVMRDLRSDRRELSHAIHRARAIVNPLIEQFGRQSIERWPPAKWEEFSLNLLWRICHQGVHAAHQRQANVEHPLRLRDVLLQAVGVDIDEEINALFIRFTSAYLDQGFANWSLLERDSGYFKAFFEVYGTAGALLPKSLQGLAAKLQEIRQKGMTPLDCIESCLDELAVSTDSWEEYLTQTLLALPGWTGMIWQMETNASWAPQPVGDGSLIEYLAMRLLVESVALKNIASDTLTVQGPLSELSIAVHAHKPAIDSRGDEQLAFTIFQLAQILGWLPSRLLQLSQSDWSAVVGEISQFTSFQRRRLYHQAYERRYRNQALDALSVHTQYRLPDQVPFQIICCIDDREESFRRHLEEVAPECETFGAPGFYGVAMYYQGAAEAHYRPLCPVVITPKHYVREKVVEAHWQDHQRRSESRRALGRASHRVHLGSRGFLMGMFTALGGSLASIPLIFRVLLPHTTAKVLDRFSGWLRPPAETDLTLHRQSEEPGSDEDSLGYSLEEMASVVERILSDIGLTSNFSPLVVVTGHGSSSLNNPHESAYNCGACSGGRGGPNARAFAHMANDIRVREQLARRGIAIPAETWFVGAYHNTCNEEVIYYDLQHLPKRLVDSFQIVRDQIEEATQRNAHERCRRFESAPLDLSPEEALRHVEARSSDLAQARPEYNHATNSLCIVARRNRTRGLFLDRRSFLQSYDPTQDDVEGTILHRILQAAIPVCAGISLEYYFSTVDVAGWGCGSKLPHNITSLLGVMEGAASDLRPGLSRQMVEIHEPMRILCVIETTPRVMQAILDRDPNIHRLCLNEWVQLALLSPESNQVFLLHNGKFESYDPESTQLPVVMSSQDWYRGWRENLEFAQIVPASAEVNHDGK